MLLNLKQMMSAPTKKFIVELLQVEEKDRPAIGEILRHDWMRADPVVWNSIKQIYSLDSHKSHTPVD